MVRMPRGTHVVSTNRYFTFTNNRNYPDIKVSAVPKWATPEHMGTTYKSRTLFPSHFGDSREHPVRSMLVLRAWVLWKARATGFCDKRSSRRKLLSIEAEALRRDIEGMSSEAHPTTGNVPADVLITELAPDALAPKQVATVHVTILDLDVKMCIDDQGCEHVCMRVLFLALHSERPAKQPFQRCVPLGF